MDLKIIFKRKGAYRANLIKEIYMEKANIRLTVKTMMASFTMAISMEVENTRIKILNYKELFQMIARKVFVTYFLAMVTSMLDS